MTDNVAVLDGYTEEVYAVKDDTQLFLLVKPKTDLHEEYKAWDEEHEQEIGSDVFYIYRTN